MCRNCRSLLTFLPLLFPVTVGGVTCELKMKAPVSVCATAGMDTVLSYTHRWSDCKQDKTLPPSEDNSKAVMIALTNMFCDLEDPLAKQNDGCAEGFQSVGRTTTCMLKPEFRQGRLAEFSFSTLEEFAEPPFLHHKLPVRCMYHYVNWMESWSAKAHEIADKDTFIYDFLNPSNWEAKDRDAGTVVALEPLFMTAVRKRRESLKAKIPQNETSVVASNNRFEKFKKSGMEKDVEEEEQDGGEEDDYILPYIYDLANAKKQMDDEIAKKREKKSKQ